MAPIDPTPSDTLAWRRKERERLVAARLDAPPELRRAWSAAIERRLGELLAGLPGDIGFYWPHKGEFDPRPLAQTLFTAGRRLSLPAIAAPGGALEYRPWRPDMTLESGLHGIPVPPAGAVAHPAIVVVPVVGFDADNYRLGYGGGYFDRSLAAAESRPVTIGVGFELARLATIHPRPHDVPMDLIVTEAGVQQRAGSGDRD